jgi:hypothetical protein
VPKGRAVAVAGRNAGALAQHELRPHGFVRERKAASIYFIFRKMIFLSRDRKENIWEMVRWKKRKNSK